MRISSLKILDLRVIASLEMEPEPGLNFIEGDNGAGKTSILEGIYLAGRGRTFRHSDAGPMIRQGATNATVVVGFSNDDGSKRSLLGVCREKKHLSCRLNGQDIRKRSILAETLPVQWIGSQPQLLLGLGPEVRRQFIDMGLFHVEQSYLAVLAEFQRVLKQRNSALRQGSSQPVRVWDQPFQVIAEEMNRRRGAFIEALMPRAEALLDSWEAGFSTGFRYRQGWHPDEPFVEQLQKRLEIDMRVGHSTIGPQRAELELLADGVNAERRLSRGQQKILVLALNLAMFDLIAERRHRAPVLLIDDLGAELDRGNRDRIVSDLEDRGAQVFLTMIGEGTLMPQSAGAVMFHVEHGRLAGSQRLSVG